MVSSTKLTNIFFHDLKKYNSTNFRNIQKADLNDVDANTLKAFSAVVTRYFIFCENHPEIDITDLRVLYYTLRIDLIARYFSEYPSPDIDATDHLRLFQLELQHYLKDNRGGFHV